MALQPLLGMSNLCGQRKASRRKLTFFQPASLHAAFAIGVFLGTSTRPAASARDSLFHICRLVINLIHPFVHPFFLSLILIADALCLFGNLQAPSPATYS